MSNEEKLKQAFVNALDVKLEEVENLVYKGTQPWDSVGHLALMREIEDGFDIMMDTEDIIQLSSYEKGKEILQKNYDIAFE